MRKKAKNFELNKEFMFKLRVIDRMKLQFRKFRKFCFIKDLNNKINKRNYLQSFEFEWNLNFCYVKILKINTMIVVFQTNKTTDCF